MPNYTVAVNEQPKLDALAFDRKRVNDHRQNQEPQLPVLTEPQFIQWIVDAYVDQLVPRHRDSQKTEVGDAYLSASPAIQTQVEAVLGVTRR